MSAWSRLRGHFVRRTQGMSQRVALRLDELEDRTVPTLVGQQLFPADNPWNQKIASAPVAANSAAIMSNIVSKAGDGRLHPDFGQDSNTSGTLYGIPYNIVHGNSTPKVAVVLDAYPDESDPLTVPIPLNVVIEGDNQNGPRVGVNNRGDSHLIIYDVDNNIAYELYRASRPSENADGKWHADQETVWNMNTNAYRTLGWTSADAAGLPILAGLARPDEGLPTSQGGQGAINHAIRFTLQNSIILDQYIYPASHAANPGNANAAIQPPMGARFRLKAGVDLSQFNPQARIIAQAMKDYGMIVADNGSNFFFSGASSAVDASNQQTLTWNDNDIQDSVHGLKSLHFSDFEVVDLTPVVTDLSVHSGAAGASVTITGKNFSGASGHLQVNFGSVPATSVTIVDDSHVIAIAPAGSGTVDIRVQSGVTTAANPDNIKNTVFGYGVSAISAGDRFTFGTPVNQPPTVATRAAAAPNPITGLTTTLSVLGADDGGEASLVYTWTSSGPAAVTFARNAANNAKSTTATFTQPGSYTFTVTIADASNLTVTSSVSVSFLVDNTPPTSQVNRLPAFETNPNFLVTWTGSDSSGIASYDVYVAIDGGAYAAWKTATPLTQGLYAGAIGHRYDFYSVATDNAGLRQPTPTSPQASVTLKKFDVPPPPNLFTIAAKIAQSDENFSNFIRQAYLAYLGRNPDSGGLNYWLGRMRSGQTTDEQLEAELVGSGEYIAVHGGFGAGWITGIYNDLLGRTPAPSEVAGWVAQLTPGVAPVTIAFRFAHSGERAATRVRDNYQNYLGRSPAPAEVNAWVDQFMNYGMTTEVMAARFVGSAEFFNNSAKGASVSSVWIVAAHRAILGRAPTLTESTSIAAALLPPANLTAIASQLTHADESYKNFIVQAYNTYLNRSPDVGGLNYWLGLMRSGQVSDEKLEASFVGSSEYIAAHGGSGAGWVRGMYIDLLNRTPAPSEVNGWVATLNAGASPVAVALGFAASAEREGIRVRQNYQTFLGRTPAASEVNGWVDLFVNRGMTSETMTAGFIGSTEYFQNPAKGNGSVIRWLDAAFMDIDKRPITESELLAFLAILS
jgi:hypothetical protein